MLIEGDAIYALVNGKKELLHFFGNPRPYWVACLARLLDGETLKFNLGLKDQAKDVLSIESFVFGVRKDLGLELHLERENRSTYGCFLKLSVSISV